MFLYWLFAAIPLNELATANKVFETLRETTGTDWGPSNLSVALASRANNQQTHWGMAVGVTEADWAVIEGMLDRDELPKGVARGQATAFKKLIHAHEPYGQRHPLEGFNEFLTANNLKIVDVPVQAAGTGRK